jgi:Regulator of chromosome condensation (RCC1) repeat
MVEADSPIGHFSQVACGDRHTAVVTRSKKVVTFGSGQHGQLGHGDGEDCLRPKTVEALITLQVTAVSAGSTHTAVIANQGELYLWGFGESLHPKNYSNIVDSPRLVKMKDRVCQVAAGQSHILALTEAGDVYAFGSGTMGQLGHGATTNVRLPRLVLRGKNVQEIAAGRYHSMAITSHGVLYSWGCGESGQLAHDALETELLPRVVESTLPNVVGQIACGEHHSFCLSSIEHASVSNDVLHWKTIEDEELKLKKTMAKELPSGLKTQHVLQVEQERKRIARQIEADMQREKDEEQRHLQEQLDSIEPWQDILREVQREQAAQEEKHGRKNTDINSEKNHLQSYANKISRLAAQSSPSGAGGTRSNKHVHDQDDDTMLDSHFSQKRSREVRSSDDRLALTIARAKQRLNSRNKTLSGAKSMAQLQPLPLRASARPSDDATGKSFSLLTPAGGADKRKSLRPAASTAVLPTNPALASRARLEVGANGIVSNDDLLNNRSSRRRSNAFVNPASVPSSPSAFGNITVTSFGRDGAVTNSPTAGKDNDHHLGLGKSGSPAHTQSAVTLRPNGLLGADSGAGAHVSSSGALRPVSARSIGMVGHTNGVSGTQAGADQVVESSATHPLIPRAAFIEKTTLLMRKVKKQLIDTSTKAEERTVRDAFHLKKEYNTLKAHVSKAKGRLKRMRNAYQFQQATEEEAARQRASANRIKDLKMKLVTLNTRLMEAEENKRNYELYIMRMKEEDVQLSKQIDHLRMLVTEYERLLTKLDKMNSRITSQSEDYDQEIIRFAEDVRKFSRFADDTLANYQNSLQHNLLYSKKNEKVSAQRRTEREQKRQERLHALREQADKVREQDENVKGELRLWEERVTFYEQRFHKITAATGLSRPEDIINKFFFNDEMTEDLRRDMDKKKEEHALLNAKRNDLVDNLAHMKDSHVQSRWRDVDTLEVKCEDESKKMDSGKNEAVRLMQKLALVQEGVVNLVNAVDDTIGCDRKHAQRKKARQETSLSACMWWMEALDKRVSQLMELTSTQHPRAKSRRGLSKRNISVSSHKRDASKSSVADATDDNMMDTVQVNASTVRTQL